MFVVGTTSHAGDFVAYVRDDRSPGGDIQRFRIGDAVDDGRLVLVHPRGMIVRVTREQAGQPAAVEDFFYPIGGHFKQRVTLEEAQLPDVVRGV